MSKTIENQAGRSEWLADVRKTAEKAFSGMEWPRPDQEEWRRTALDGLDLDSFVENREGQTQVRVDVPESLVAAGGFAAALPDGAMATEMRERVLSVLERSSSTLDNRFIAWNLSSWSVGAFVYVPDGADIKEPVRVEYSGFGRDKTAQVHTVVLVGRGSAATLLQRHEDDGGLFWNGGTTLVLDEGSRLSYSTTQDTSADSRFFHHGRAYLARDAYLNGFEALVGSNLSKVRSEIFLEGQGAEAVVNGLYFAREGRHMDIKTVQYHREPHSGSRAFYKGAVSKGGRSIYQGLIDVDHKAEGTDAYLTNNNLILDDGARADSIPCLEIRTNDVKCSHGSTSGRINEEELFYLMSRGIKREDAVRDLIVGYFEDVIRLAPEAEQDVLRSRIEKLVVDGIE